MFEQSYNTPESSAIRPVQTLNNGQDNQLNNSSTQAEKDRFVEIYNQMFEELGRMKQDLKDMDERRPKLISRIERLGAALLEMARTQSEHRTTRPYTRQADKDAAPAKPKQKRIMKKRDPEQNFYSEEVLNEVANLIDRNGAPTRAEAIYNHLIKNNIIEPVDSTTPVRIFAIRLAKCTQDIITYNRNTKEWGLSDMFSASGRRDRARRMAEEGSEGVRVTSFRPNEETVDAIAAGSTQTPSIADGNRTMAFEASNTQVTPAGISGLYEIRRNQN